MKEIIVTRVAPGESLSEIAARYDVTVEELQRWNGIENPDLVLIGQRIVIHEGADRSESSAVESVMSQTTLGPDIVTSARDVWIGGTVVLALLLLLLFRRRVAATPVSRAPIDRSEATHAREAHSSPEDASGTGEGDSRRSEIVVRPTIPGSSKSGPENEPIPWQHLCQYLQRCIEAEAAESLVPFAKENVLWFRHDGDEKLVVGHSDVTAAPPAFSGRLRPQTRPIIYGWPTVVVKDRDHVPKVAPLFTCSIEPERRHDNEWILHATMEPEFNLAITASGLFDPSVTEDISDLLSHGLPFGDAEAFAALARHTAELLGLAILSPLDAESLDLSINRKEGVYNTAISVLTTGPVFTKTLLEELRELQLRKDWTTTAAAHLCSDRSSVNQVNGHPVGPLAAALACNHSQEQTLECIRTQPLTVVTGPPGTGKTQLVVNAVTNAWLDGERVLVASTNNAAVDVAVDRAARDIIDGLLMRTGNREAREAVPARIAVAKSQAAERRGNQARVRAKLRNFATERTQLLEKLTRLDELDAELLQAIDEREQGRQAWKEAAQTLWSAAQPPDSPIRSKTVRRRAKSLLRTRWFRRFRTRRLLRQLGCLDTASLAQLVEWARLDLRIAELDTQLQIARRERQRLETEVGIHPPACSKPIANGQTQAFRQSAWKRRIESSPAWRIWMR